jgi:hypothetical protein
MFPFGTRSYSNIHLTTNAFAINLNGEGSSYRMQQRLIKKNMKTTKNYFADLKNKLCDVNFKHELFNTAMKILKMWNEILKKHHKNVPVFKLLEKLIWGCLREWCQVKITHAKILKFGHTKWEEKFRKWKIISNEKEKVELDVYSAAIREFCWLDFCFSVLA